MPTICSPPSSVDRASLPEIDDATAPAGSADAARRRAHRPCGRHAVAVGTGDDFANAIGAGVVEPGIVSCNLGTGEAVGAVSDDLLIDADGLVETHGYLGDRFFISNPGWLSGGAVAWFLATFGVDDAGARCRRWRRHAPAGCDGLLFLPALSGAMAPRWVAGARGAFYGLTAEPRRAACARALLEGCAFAMRDVVDRLDAMGVAHGSHPAHRRRRAEAGSGRRSAPTWRERPVEYGPAARRRSAWGGNPRRGRGGSGRKRRRGGERGRRRIPDLRARPGQRRGLPSDAHARYRRLFESLTPMFEGRPTDMSGSRRDAERHDVIRVFRPLVGIQHRGPPQGAGRALRHRRYADRKRPAACKSLLGARAAQGGRLYRRAGHRPAGRLVRSHRAPMAGGRRGGGERRILFPLR